MPYFGQFEFFDPFTGEVPFAPIPYLSSVVAQARLMLAHRTSEEVKAVAVNVDFAIQNYYVQAKDSANGVREDPLPDYQYELHALQHCVNDWDNFGGEQIADVPRFEVFSVLALWQAADSLNWALAADEITVNARLNGEKSLDFDASRSALVRIALAGESAMQALDAIRYAEFDGYSSIYSAQKNELVRQIESARLKKSMAAEKMNVARQQKRNAAQAIVLARWEKNASEFRSAEKAGAEFSLWLAKQGFDFEPRTITTWIRAHAKKLGIKLR